ncbi:uncharacterized protein LOC125039592 [Penaeus chinensis]|uniref:uncharacterized protein LOC125039592 n=1 Tax=Penaeus chinensis TaxID=139456 RepID=UPI001FB60AA8|nr:uncharacterized protein LOC125039592 [Penaeus chinensis]
MQSVVWYAVLLVAGVSAVTPAAGPQVSPWIDTSLCDLSDSLMVCQLKKGQCSPVGSVFSPPGGPVKAITSCANTTGVVLGPQFYLNIGLAFVMGSPESLADKTSSDPNTVIAIRRCALNATGLLNADMMTLNRTVIAASMSSAFSTPALGAAVASAVASCPEPVDYKITDFVTCLRTACMVNVSATSLMKMATEMTKTMTAAPPTGAPASA